MGDESAGAWEREFLEALKTGSTDEAESLVGRLSAKGCAPGQGFRESALRGRDMIWKKHGRLLAFHALIGDYCKNAGIRHRDSLLQDKSLEHDPLLHAQMYLHGEACRVFLEVHELLAGGFPDGAFSRWRTLHEAAANAVLIQQHGQDGAIAYLEWGRLDQIRGMELYQKSAEAFGRKPFSDEELVRSLEVKGTILAAWEERGWSYDRRDWAAHLPGLKGKSGFGRVSELVGLSGWASDHKAASRGIHAHYRGFDGVFGMLGKPGILVGRTLENIEEPADCSAIAMAQVTIAFLAGHVDGPGVDADWATSLFEIAVIDRLVSSFQEEIAKCLASSCD